MGKQWVGENGRRQKGKFLSLSNCIMNVKEFLKIGLDTNKGYNHGKRGRVKNVSIFNNTYQVLTESFNRKCAHWYLFTYLPDIKKKLSWWHHNKRRLSRWICSCYILHLLKFSLRCDKNFNTLHYTTHIFYYSNCHYEFVIVHNSILSPIVLLV